MVFSLSIANLINILFIAAGIGICGLCFLHITSSVHLQKAVRRYFQVFFSLITLYIAAHLARLLMEGQEGSVVRIALYAVTFIEMLAAGFMTQMLSMLILTAAKTERGISRRILTALVILICVHAAILIIGAFTDLIYYYDDSNMYQRGAGYLLSNLSPILMMVIDIVLLIRYRKNMDRHARSAFWIFMIAPIVAILIQSFSYGIQFIIFATVASAVYMFSVIVKNQNKEYEQQQIESSRLETELSMASSIQADMLPSIFPAFPDRKEFDIYATMDPAKEVGGDFYDFFLIDDDHLCMVMADVSGKGVPAALLMMAMKIIFANNAMLGNSPGEILTDANAAICSNNREEMFVTAWLGILELSTGTITAANAGHEYPVMQKKDGKFELVKDRHGLVIGGMNGVKYKEYQLQMEPGSKLFLYTDGVPEATNAHNELFGVDRMLEALNEDTSLNVQKVLEQVRRCVDDFVKDAEQFDDLTMLCVEYLGEEQEKA